MNTHPKGKDIVEQAKAMSGDLPANYAAAKKQMALVQKIDECKDWADKAAALASYARQGNDKTLMNYAMKIKARAIRRAGELLDQYDDRGRPPENKVGDHPNLSQAEAGKDAGLSPHQIKEAVRVANVPADLFEAQVESDKPPTITALAEQGKTSRPKKVTLPAESTKPGFQAATYLIGGLKRMRELIEAAQTPEFVLDAMNKDEIEDARKLAIFVQQWLEDFISKAGGSNASA